MYRSIEHAPNELSSLLSLWGIQKNKSLSSDNEYPLDQPEVLFITSLPPRECGIASYSQDLLWAIDDHFENGFKSVVCALETDLERPAYTKKPLLILNTDQFDSYLQAAQQINDNKNIRLVVIQHEFGFFAAQEEGFKQFIQTIAAPIVFVFHTVLPRPSKELTEKVQHMSQRAASVIVMTTNARNILVEEYGVPIDHVLVIPHGTHLVSHANLTEKKQRLQLNDRQILSTFGLISSQKNIETTLYAIPEIAKKHPSVLFLILGKTHPVIIKQEGEKYRHSLEKIVAELHIGAHVRFVNEYLPIDDLLEYLQLTDVYLFTSNDPNQAVSGTFSYALSSGCPVISTPIPHAKELLNETNGVFIDFENHAQLAQAAIALLDDKERRASISSASLQKMASTAWANSAIAHVVHFREIMKDDSPLQYRIPALNLKHVRQMTTSIGIIQFAKISTPDLSTGYTLDDNARALIAACQCYERTNNPNEFGAIKTYLEFLERCLQPNGMFLNYVNSDLEFTCQNNHENLDDSSGRAVWALGYVVSLRSSIPESLYERANTLLEKALPKIDRIYSTRAMAFIIKGLFYQNKPENMSILQIFANRLVQMFKHEKSDNWVWFENYITYGNSSLAEAMLCAYQCTHDVQYKHIALESFEFLLSKIFRNGQIKVISNKGWLFKGEDYNHALCGEQPIDVAYTLLALEKFYSVFKSPEYKTKAIESFNWFLGANDLRQIIYNPSTGGCYDGLEEHNVNLNQGAESTISYLLARLSIERMHALETPSKNKRTRSNANPMLTKVFASQLQESV
jgi:glycosyltransferase involved in cell wall biosynthesis